MRRSPLAISTRRILTAILTNIPIPMPTRIRWHNYSNSSASGKTARRPAMQDRHRRAPHCLRLLTHLITRWYRAVPRRRQRQTRRRGTRASGPLVTTMPTTPTLPPPLDRVHSSAVYCSTCSSSNTNSSTSLARIKCYRAAVVAAAVDGTVTLMVIRMLISHAPPAITPTMAA